MGPGLLFSSPLFQNFWLKPMPLFFIIMNVLKFFRFTLFCALAIAAVACSDNDIIDNRDLDYGYVQFKLYKEASYLAADTAQSRAVVKELDYLHDASKIRVHLVYGQTRISQVLTLSAANNEAAEYGLRSSRLQLLEGEYSVEGFSLYDINDELLYEGTQASSPLLIEAGGLQTYDLTVNVRPRGKARFSLYKANIAKDDSSSAATQSRALGSTTFDEVDKADITVQNIDMTSERYTFTSLKMNFNIIFDENNESDGTTGYQTSVITCDSAVSLPAANYRIYEYTLYSSRGTTLDYQRFSDSNTIPGDFTVTDNVTTDVKVGITLDLDAEYLADYRALKEIWDALDGPNWYYAGELFPAGSNWDFNKDIDLWGDQPGVQLHANGRVARIDLSDFGPRGAIPEALGQLTAMVELYIGTHNDTNLYEYDPTLDNTLSQRSRNRMANHGEFLRMKHVAPQMSEPCARGLKEHNIVVPETSLYEKGFAERDIIDPATGLQKNGSWQLKDLVSGKLCNGITALPQSIGNLKQLEYLYIANGEIAEIPATIANLESLTDLEIYNCPKMTQFPMAIAEMPELVSINISNNKQWSAQEVEAGLDALANGPSASKLQILYCSDNNVETLPESFSQLTKIGLLDLANNNISTLHPLGPSVAPVQVYFDNNKITEFPVDAQGYYCQMNDMETFSAANNQLTVFPNIFRTNGYTISTIDLSSNQITQFPSRSEFRGVRVTTLTLTNNPIPVFPAVLVNNDEDSAIAFIVMRGCNLSGFEKDCFVGKNSAALQSLDLSYNHLTELPDDFRATNLPYLYGVDLSHNSFSKFPYAPFDAYTLTILAVRSQRDANGRRCLTEWPKGVYQHTGLRALYLGSNDLRKVEDTISYLIYYLDISDNPNITFDASDICAYWQAGYYLLIYDKSQNILNCEAMLQ